MSRVAMLLAQKVNKEAASVEKLLEKMALADNLSEMRETPLGELIISGGIEKYCAVYPPKLASLNLMGYLNDEQHKPVYFQGNGRSSVLGGRAFYIFDGTVFKGQNDEESKDLTSSAAVVPDPKTKPLVSVHLPLVRSGTVEPFLRLTELEEDLEKENVAEIILTAPGGICGTEGDMNKGYVWYQKYVQEKKSDGNTKETFHSTGLARVDVDEYNGRNLKSRRVLQEKPLFNKHEPSFGTFCAVKDDKWYYLWGKLGQEIYLSRVNQNNATVRDQYEFWDGYQFTPYITAISPVFTGYTSGTIFKSQLFGHSYQWVFIGGTELDAPVAAIGVSKDICGPFLMSDLVDGKRLHPAYRRTTALYAHSWAFKEKTGQLLLTWNEAGSGDIVAVKLQFEMLHTGAIWRNISLENLPAVVSSLARGRHDVIETYAHSKGVHSEIEHGKEGKASIKLHGPTTSMADDAADSICNLISHWCEDLTQEEHVIKMEKRGLVLTRTG